MKTIRQHFQELPEPYRTKALAHTEPVDLDDPSPSLEDALLVSFAWANKPEGHDFWRTASKGEFPEAVAADPRIQDLEARVAALEGLLAVDEDDDDEPEQDAAPEYRYFRDDMSEWRFNGTVGDHRWLLVGGWRGRCACSLDELLVDPAVRECGVDGKPLDRRSDSSSDGPGFRFLEPGEMILEGDEVRECGGWKKVTIIPTICYLTEVFRRALAPEVEPARYPTTELPDGFDRWECRGLGWNPGCLTTYTFFDTNAETWYSGDCSRLERPCGWYYVEYWEAVKDAPATVEPPARYPATPLPEGFDRWECRGLGWAGAAGCTYTTGTSGDHPIWDEDQSNGWTRAYGCLEYWEAVVVNDEPAVEIYRLLTPGEVILATDEAYIRQGGWMWEAMGDDSATGRKFDPSWQHPVRRPIKSYADA